jgi:hypothetical protein
VKNSPLERFQTPELRRAGTEYSTVLYVEPSPDICTVQNLDANRTLIKLEGAVQYSSPPCVTPPCLPVIILAAVVPMLLPLAALSPTTARIILLLIRIIPIYLSILAILIILLSIPIFLLRFFLLA